MTPLPAPSHSLQSRKHPWQRKQSAITAKIHYTEIMLVAIPFFFQKYPRREDRLLPKPLRGESAAASGLWEEGDKEWQVCVARSAQPTTELAGLRAVSADPQSLCAGFHKPLE